MTGVNYNEAGELMRRARWSVKVAIVMHKTALNYADALSRLNNAGGSIRDATGEDVGTRLRELLATDTASPNLR